MIKINKKGFTVTLIVLFLLNLVFWFLDPTGISDGLKKTISIILLPITPPVNFLTAIIVALLLAQWKKEPEIRAKNKYPFYLVLSIVILPYLMAFFAFSMFYTG